MCPIIKQKPRIIILIGQAYSGKTRWAKKFLEDNGETAVVIQREGLYRLLAATRYPEDITREIAETMIESGISRALSLRHDVILDGRNTTVEDVLSIIETFKDVARIYYKIFDVDEMDFFNRRMYIQSMQEEPASLQEYKVDTYNLDLIKEQLRWHPEVKPYVVASNGMLF